MLNGQQIEKSVMETALANKSNNCTASNIIYVDGTKYYLVHSHYILGLTFDKSEDAIKNNKISLTMPQIFTLVVYVRDDHRNIYSDIGTPIVIQDKMLIDYENKSFNFI